jgi:hypothetical protein
MKMPSTIKAIAPTPAPTPIPAFAPVERLLFLEAVTGLKVEEVVVGVETIDWFVEGSGDDAEDTSVGIGSPKFCAIVYRVIPLLSSQHRLERPQHQVIESAAPVHGVTS